MQTDCPFSTVPPEGFDPQEFDFEVMDWWALHHVDRWNGRHTGGPNSTFVRKKNMLVNTKPVPPSERYKSLADEFVPFGKHRGKRWREVPHDYLRWLLKAFEDTAKNKRVRESAKSVLNSHEKFSG